MNFRRTGTPLLAKCLYYSEITVHLIFFIFWVKIIISAIINTLHGCCWCRCFHDVCWICPFGIDAVEVGSWLLVEFAANHKSFAFSKVVFIAGFFLGCDPIKSANNYSLRKFFFLPFLCFFCFLCKVIATFWTCEPFVVFWACNVVAFEVVDIVLPDSRRLGWEVFHLVQIVLTVLWNIFIDFRLGSLGTAEVSRWPRRGF